MIGRLIEIGGWLRRRAENVAVALLSLMFACFILQIFFRYVLNNPVGWSEEVIITTWLWTVLWGAAFILGVALVALYGISLPAAYSYVSFMKVERSAYLRVPINWLYSVYIIFAVACIARYCWLVYRALRGAKAPATDPARLAD